MENQGKGLQSLSQGIPGNPDPSSLLLLSHGNGDPKKAASQTFPASIRLWESWEVLEIPSLEFLSLELFPKPLEGIGAGGTLGSTGMKVGIEDLRGLFQV